ncbi:hypothetical protein AX17_005385 [Amanita inopinata Kibby_2008]|nr:hypothetical protein AX17_005385 [Amanita inopinata Kibby_2008]
MTIIFYDIPSKVVGGPWNPNTYKTRYTLNFKGVPYKTEWIEYTEIEPLCKEKGIAASTTWADGRPSYTLPSILDTDAKVGVTESHQIAEYLDKAFPNTPKVIPPGTEALQAAYVASYLPHFKGLWQFVLPATLASIDHAPSNEYFHKTRSEIFGQDIKTMKPSGAAWDAAIKELREGLDVLDQQLQKSGGLFIMGDNPTFADFSLLGWVKWGQSVLGKDSAEWKAIATFNDGRWAKRLEILDQKYGQTQ